METIDHADRERKDATERSMKILDAVEVLEFADQKREKIIGRMTELARAKGEPLFDDYYYYGKFMIYVAGRGIRYWRKGKRTEKCVDADIALDADGNRWWRRLKITDRTGGVEFCDECRLAITESYGKWPDCPYAETIHLLNDVGEGVLATLFILYESDQAVLYERNEATGEYEVRNCTGKTLSHLGLPEDLRTAKYVQGIPIKDLLEIDFAAAAGKIEEYAELDKLMKAVGIKEE